MRLRSQLGVAERLPKGSIEFSMLGPGAHLRAHCGPSNHRIRLHLPVVLPPIEDGQRELARMRVGEGESMSRAWVAGRVTAFDDSYEHEVWNNASTARVVLMVDASRQATLSCVPSLLIVSGRF
jgi:aspartyl/asparaginyl beta-hydroxylase (cupin superfamily)